MEEKPEAPVESTLWQVHVRARFGQSKTRDERRAGGG
jgi:hypothetical protein